MFQNRKILIVGKHKKESLLSDKNLKEGSN